MTKKKRKPLTREDVLKAIEANGGTAEGLDLSEKLFEEGIDLRGLDLKGVILRNAIFPTSSKPEIIEGANLTGIHLEKADLTGAHLERADLFDTHLDGAILRNAHLEGAYIWDTHLEGANLMMAHLQGANLMRTKLSPDINLQDVDWGNYILDEEKPGSFDSAVASYRHLKVWYTHAGYSDIAAKFYYREREASRKDAKHWYDRLALEILRVLFGYGERWRRVLISIAVLILLFASIYLVISTFIPNFGTLTPNTFLHSLYYSAVSFTALGYGKWAPQPTGWIKGIGAFESLVGISMMALLMVTFFRKWTR